MSKEAGIGRHLTFVMLVEAARLAGQLSLPLKDFQELAGAAYFKELSRASLTQTQMAKQLGTSVRTIAGIAASLRDTFFRVEQEASLPRKIEHLLWVAPASKSRIAQLLDDENPEKLQKAIETLLGEGRIREDLTARTPTLRVTSGASRLVREDWVSRLDAVGNLMRNAGDTIANRFLGDRKASMARTVSLKIRQSSLHELEELYEKVVYPRLVELEESAADHDDGIDINLSIFWARAT